MGERATPGLVASEQGVRVDTDAGWSAPVAVTVDECDRLAASFAAMAARLRDRPDLVQQWLALPDEPAEPPTACHDPGHADIVGVLATVVGERNQARRQRDDLREVAGEARADLAAAQARANQLFEALREVLSAFPSHIHSGNVRSHLVAASHITEWRAVLDADPDDPASTPAPAGPDLLGVVGRLAEGVSALQELLAEPHYGPVRVVDGRRERWVTDPLPGGYVCAERVRDGECGRPVESEPCEVHHPLPPDGPDR